MKTPIVIGLVVAAVVITVVIEETRFSSMRQSWKTQLAEGGAKTPASVSTASLEIPAGPVKTKSRSEREPAAPAKDSKTSDESFAKTARKMWDNPAGRSMMNQGVKMAVGMMYQDFVDGLNLTKEEGDYFKDLLGKEMSDQQELGMKMLGATPDERKALAEELKQRGVDHEAEIKKFLNSDEDFDSFTDYKNHLPERQQLDGIRSVMSSKGAPLDADTEAKLVDAMYRARTESNAPDLSGPNAMDEFVKGNIVETYEKSWEIQQEALRGETSKILNETQMAAFEEYQKQAKEMQLMGLKMAEKMMPEMNEEIENVIRKPETKVDFE